MNLYRTDKPDIRFGMPLIDITSLFINSATAFNQYKTIKCIKVNDYATISNEELDELNRLIQTLNDLLWVKYLSDQIDTSFKPSNDICIKIKEFTKAKDNALILIISNMEKNVVNEILGLLRCEIAKHLNIIPVDSPMFEHSKGQYIAADHLSIQPKNKTLHYLATGELEKYKLIVITSYTMAIK